MRTFNLGGGSTIKEKEDLRAFSAKNHVTHRRSGKNEDVLDGTPKREGRRTPRGLHIRGYGKKNY